MQINLGINKTNTMFGSGGALLMQTEVRVHPLFAYVNVKGCGGVEVEG